VLAQVAERLTPGAVPLGVADALKGQVPLGLVVLKAGVDRPHEDIFHRARCKIVFRGVPPRVPLEGRGADDRLRDAEHTAHRANAPPPEPPARHRRARKAWRRHHDNRANFREMACGKPYRNAAAKGMPDEQRRRLNARRDVLLNEICVFDGAPGRGRHWCVAKPGKIDQVDGVGGLEQRGDPAETVAIRAPAVQKHDVSVGRGAAHLVDERGAAVLEGPNLIVHVGIAGQFTMRPSAGI